MAEIEEKLAGLTVAETEIEQPAAESAEHVPSTTSSTRLYVGNLAYRVRWQGLKDFMRQAGNVKHAEVFTDFSGRSKGCGIVEFDTVEEAQKAIDELNDTELEGRKVFIREDREQGQGRSAGAGAPAGAGGARPDRAQCQLYVGNLPYTVSWQDLKDFFKENGFEPLRADIIDNGEGYSKGCGTVLLATPEDAQAAIDKLDGFDFQGRPVQLKLDKFAGRPAPFGAAGGFRGARGGRGGYRGGRGRGGMN